MYIIIVLSYSDSCPILMLSVHTGVSQSNRCISQWRPRACWARGVTILITPVNSCTCLSSYHYEKARLGMATGRFGFRFSISITGPVYTLGPNYDQTLSIRYGVGVGSRLGQVLNVHQVLGKGFTKGKIIPYPMCNI